MIEILTGDSRELLKLVPDGVIQTCITSPPYFNQRDYGVAGQIGLETEVTHYVAELVEIFRQVRRVLRDDGTLWLNLGDSYNAYNGNRGITNSRLQSRPEVRPVLPSGAGLTTKGLKPKDLIGIPWRVAFALQEDGWYLRSDIIWCKNNPMPESVRDRPTRAHEYVFLFSKRPRYYFDQDAIREPHTSLASPPGNKGDKFKGRLGPVGWRDKDYDQSMLAHQQETGKKGRPHGVAGFHPLGRNRRSWWQVNTRPCREAHFATFPPDLVRPMLLAGSSAQACAACGAPSMRLLEFGPRPTAWQQACGGDGDGAYHGQATKDYAGAKAQNASDVKRRILAGMKTARTVDWQASCTCGSETRPSWILDPFAGAGTVGVVAQELGRSALLFELNPDYVALARRRLEK